jgi:hypothetical protein
VLAALSQKTVMHENAQNISHIYIDLVLTKVMCSVKIRIRSYASASTAVIPHVAATILSVCTKQYCHGITAVNTVEYTCTIIIVASPNAVASGTLSFKPAVIYVRNRTYIVYGT